MPSTATMLVGWLLVTTRMNLVMFSKRRDETRNFSAASVARTEVPWRHTAMMVMVTMTMMATKTPRMVLRRVSVASRASVREILRIRTHERLAMGRDTISASSPV